MLSQRQIALVQGSFVYCVVIPDEVSSTFYRRLFEAAPATRRMFGDDLHEQGRKLVMTLAMIVDGLERLDAIVPSMNELAIRHVRYGVTEAHYAIAGVVLLDTLRQLLAARFDDATEAAWEAAYSLIAETMIAASRTVGRFR